MDKNDQSTKQQNFEVDANNQLADYESLIQSFKNIKDSLAALEKIFSK